jgi:hypothetical protein
MTDAQGDVRIHALLDEIRAGRIIEAMHEFYAEDIVMEEPAHGKTEGFAANLAREEQFVASVQEMRRFDVSGVGVGEGVSFYECVMDWLGADGNEVHVEQVSVARWKHGKIVHERFYYAMG